MTGGHYFIFKQVNMYTVIQVVLIVVLYLFSAHILGKFLKIRSSDSYPVDHTKSI